MAEISRRSAARRRRRRRMLFFRRILIIAFVAAAAVAAIIAARNFLPLTPPGDKVEIPSWITSDLLDENPYSRPGTKLKKIDGVVIHYVGNPGTTAAANRSYFASLAESGETCASAHFVVGLDGEIIQCVPLGEVAYCSNSRNVDTVSIEVCHADDSGEFSDVTMQSVIRLTAWLCEEFKLKPSDVIRHYDVTGKVCPKYYVDHPDAWQKLLSDVGEKMEEDAQ